MIRIIGGSRTDGNAGRLTNTISRDRVILFPGDTIPDEPVKRPANPLGALDYLSTVYEENDYYETGFWGRQEIPFEQAVYSGPLPSNGLEDFVPPIFGRVTSGFGFREEYSRLHKGIDIHLCIGDTVRVAMPGIVVRTGFERGGYGHFVIVSHSNGIETRYAHLKCPLVKADDVLGPHQPIGLGGNSGNSTGPHLHFEIRYMGRAIDPQRIYNFNLGNK